MCRSHPLAKVGQHHDALLSRGVPPCFERCRRHLQLSERIATALYSVLDVTHRSRAEHEQEALPSCGHNQCSRASPLGATVPTQPPRQRMPHNQLQLLAHQPSLSPSPPAQRAAAPLPASPPGRQTSLLAHCPAGLQAAGKRQGMSAAGAINGADAAGTATHN